ncbi:MAG TPA: PAC2 family protein [Streptosporangiaceae bacterium]|nr:PAC2 family protein [Streptosporangiaceae bacterium]
MVRDPGDLYEVSPDAPELDGAVMLHYLDGFIDAGAAGKLLAAHLLGSLEHDPVATFDVDRLIDYRSRRPPMTYDRDHWENYEAPELALHRFHDEDGTEFLMLTGPEPDHEWELFTAAVRDVAARLGVGLAVGFHGIPMGAPHTRPLGVTAHGTKPDLAAGYTSLVDRLQVPGSAGALLELRLGEDGRAAAGFAVHVPHYLAQAAYPAAAVALLESVSRATGLKLPDEGLREAARETDQEIQRQVEGSEEITEVVQALERQYDAFAAGQAQEGLLADGEGMPTADELGAQFERFLAERQGRTDSQEP